MEVKDVKEDYKFLNAWDTSKLQPFVTESDSLKAMEQLIGRIGEPIDAKLLIRIKKDADGKDITYFNVISLI